MNVTLTCSLTLAVSASVMLAQAPAEQTLDRVLHFTRADSPPRYQEMATVIRSVGEIRQVSVDPGQRTFSLKGTADQVALAEWLFNQLDRSVSEQTTTAQEYRFPGTAENVVRVFYLSHDPTPERLQDISIVIRSIAEIRRAFTYAGVHALILRGTPDQIALAEWLFRYLDQPASARKSGTAEYRYLDPHENFVRVFSFKHTVDPVGRQEIATVIRSTGEIRRASLYRTGGDLVMYGTADQMRLAEWLFSELDEPSGKTRAAREYRMSVGEDPEVRVLYSSADGTAQEFQEAAKAIRMKANLRRLFTYNANRAMVLRGTPEQAALAVKLATDPAKP